MGRTPSGKRDPNGTDFWWDNWPGNRGNCWHDNIGKNGTKKSVTTSPASGLPSNCATSVGKGTDEREAELFDCVGAPQGDTSTGCDWFARPPEPK
jgi:hypothetical protein